MDSSKKIFDKNFGRKWNIGVFAGQLFSGLSMLAIAAIVHHEGGFFIDGNVGYGFLALLVSILFLLIETVRYHRGLQVSKKQKQYVARDGSLHFELHPTRRQTVRYYFPDGWTAKREKRFIHVRGNGVRIVVNEPLGKLKGKRVEDSKVTPKHRSENIPSVQIPLVFTGVDRLLREK